MNQPLLVIKAQEFFNLSITQAETKKKVPIKENGKIRIPPRRLPVFFTN